MRSGRNFTFSITWITPVCMHTHTYIYIHTYIFINIYIYIFIHTYIYTYMCVYIYVCVCVLFITCEYVYIDMHLCIYNHCISMFRLERQNGWFVVWKSHRSQRAGAGRPFLPFLPFLHSHVPSFPTSFLPSVVLS